jgi:DNA topoisomerase-6 subunit A
MSSSRKDQKEDDGSAADPLRGPERTRATLDLIKRTAEDLRAQVEAGTLPVLSVPVRSLSNVRYRKKRGYLEIGPSRKERSLTVRTAKPFAQTLRLLAIAKEMVETGDFATKREAYYVSKNWADCRFSDQTESDGVLDDIEAYASLHAVAREDLGFFPEERGGSVAGRLTVVDQDPETGRPIEVDCTALGRGAYTIPRSVEHLEFRTDAEFILAIETGGMFQRLHHHHFWRRHRCIIVELGGVPTRATRRFVRRLAESESIPVYCFVDCDPYGFANIYRTFKAGSGNAAHINRFFSVPSARFLGVTPRDITDFGLEDATHELSKTDVKRARDALERDPFFRAHDEWRDAIEALLTMGVRAEQQALAKWGLNYVIETYLPQKLSALDRFLP